MTTAIPNDTNVFTGASLMLDDHSVPSIPAPLPESTQQSGGVLRLRRIAIDTYRENAAYLRRECSVYRAEGFQALAKIEGRCNGQRIEAVLNVVDDGQIVGPDELGLSEQAFGQLCAEVGHEVRLAQAEPLYRIHAEFPSSHEFAREFVKARSGYSIGEAEPVSGYCVEF
ncbi:hypothetical protein [Methylomagnum sp.]